MAMGGPDLNRRQGAETTMMKHQDTQATSVMTALLFVDGQDGNGKAE